MKTSCELDFLKRNTSENKYIKIEFLSNFYFIILFKTFFFWIHVHCNCYTDLRMAGKLSITYKNTDDIVKVIVIKIMKIFNNNIFKSLLFSLGK